MIFHYRCLGLLWGILAMVTRINQVQAAQVPPNVPLAKQQQLVMNNGVEVQTLDPHKTTGWPEANVMRDLLEGLVVMDPEGKTAPGVASYWQHSADLKTWTFYLRHDAKWSNGDPVTARDFVYSWRRLADPKTKAPKASYLMDMHLLNSQAVIQGQLPAEKLGVSALDQHTLQLQLTQPVAYLVDMLVYYPLFPVHAPTVEQYGNGVDDNKWYAVKHHVGNGAYRLTEWVVNEKLVLSRSPTYWNNPQTVINRVTYLPTNDEVVDTHRYLAGEIDISNARLPIERWEHLQQERPKEIYLAPSWSTYIFELNQAMKQFQDSRVRQALSLVLDRQQLVSKLTRQRETPAYTLNPVGMGGFSAPLPEWATWSQSRRNQEAKRLLKQAGYDEQHPLKFRLLFNVSEVHQQICLAVIGQWQQQLGCVQVNLDCQEWKVFLLSRLDGEFQMCRNGQQAVYSEPSALLNIYLSYSSENSTRYRSEAFDRIMAQAVQATDRQQRYRYYQQAEQQLAKDVPIIPLFHCVNVRLVKPYVKGLSPRNPMNTIYTKDLYLIQHKQLPSRYRQ
ncbi:MAG: ABC transporter substrate-binding protein [Candidatus Symbiodolus clandestinus]